MTPAVSPTTHRTLLVMGPQHTDEHAAQYDAACIDLAHRGFTIIVRPATANEVLAAVSQSDAVACLPGWLWDPDCRVATGAAQLVAKPRVDARTLAWLGSAPAAGGI